MKFELSQRFYFEAAHTLHREIGQEGSRRIHGHTYHAQIFLRGKPDATTGMIVDLGFFNQEIQRIKDQLDHRFLDEVPGLGAATLEGLCAYIYQAIFPIFPNVSRVRVERQASGDRCEVTAD
ncbi:6-pyruvoyl trahydropterin synthase family protein [Caballeronia sordidicola]|uniref:6-pyruvoyl trahydropterin synthase family protein n=1 Tax=Caballeronia TaxID=1827195 RepID=UPI0004CFEE8E|nr:6-carboxytetrahydropterin synthase [Caballeronia sordidicola]